MAVAGWYDLGLNKTTTKSFLHDHGCKLAYKNTQQGTTVTAYHCGEEVWIQLTGLPDSNVEVQSGVLQQ